MTWILDLDGVVWLDDTPIPGSAAAVEQLRAQGQQLVFVTNNSSVTVADQVDKLGRHGIAAQGCVVTSALVCAQLVEPGERVLCTGGPGLAEALSERGAEVVMNRGVDESAPGLFDSVAVGFHRDFDYERLRLASVAVRGGARLLASNDDSSFPTPDGPIPGGGAILAAVERAAGVSATVAGKPNQPMVDYLVDRYGETGVVVGDRNDTDGALARAMGWTFALVLSGVTTASDAVDPPADRTAPSLADLVEQS